MKELLLSAFLPQEGPLSIANAPNEASEILSRSRAWELAYLELSMLDADHRPMEQHGGGIEAASFAAGFAQDQLAGVTANRTRLSAGRIAVSRPHGRKFRLATVLLPVLRDSAGSLYEGAEHLVAGCWCL